MSALKLSEVVSVVTLVGGFTSKRDIVPALKHLFGGDGQLRACSGEAGAVWAAPWATETMVVPDYLVKVLTSLANQGHEDVDFSIGKERLTIKAKSFRGQLPLLTSDVDPMVREQLDRKPPKGGAEINEAFWESLKRVEPSVSKDATKPALTGVYWSPEGFLISSDNYRITACYPAKDNLVPCPVAKGLLIPDSLLVLLTSHRAELKKGNADDARIWFTGKGCSIYASLIQGEFPAQGVAQFLGATRKLSKSEGATVTLKAGKDVLSAAILDQVLDRLLIFTEDPNSKIKVELFKESVRFSTIETEGRMAQESVSAEVVGEAEPFYVNAKYFREAMHITPKFWHQAGKPLYVISKDKDRSVEHLLTLLSA